MTRFHLLSFSAHVILHETHLSIYVTIIAAKSFYILIVMDAVLLTIGIASLERLHVPTGAIPFKKFGSD